MVKNYLYRDISFNFLPHPVSGDLITVTDSDAIKQSVKNLVLTKFGDRKFNPKLGSAVPNVLFSTMGIQSASLLQKTIEEVLLNHEPRIRVSRINVDASIQSNSFSIEIFYTIINTTTPQLLNLTLERTR
ncbi:MAG: hypothetical protein HAW67_00560 [Endozoicomonadaceae bacterium]|nr:hypothetical protein [Endozoicomonadaceae bacterium]